MKWELPETHREALAALARRPPPELDDIDADVLEELRRWGMVMERSLEVTGKVGGTQAVTGNDCCDDF